MFKIISRYVVIGLVLVIILGMAIKSCTLKEDCDVETGEQCQHISECRPLLIDLIF